MGISPTALNFNLYTIIAVYFLILVGGIVRSMGAGMGCPDWPKCFDSYIPPSDDSSLPLDYEQYYVESRMAKNARLAKVLSSVGFDRLADRVLSDPNITTVTKFDSEKAWIEYLNRLIGVIIGFLILVNTWLSLKYWKTNKAVTISAVAALLLVLIQGWIGSLVVSTNLLPGFISFHMILALLLVVLLFYQRFKMKKRSDNIIDGRGAIGLLMIMFFIQIVLGVQVREEIDLIKSTEIARNQWIESMNWIFYVHRSYSLVLIALIGVIYWMNRSNLRVNTALKTLLIMVLAEILVGATMAYFAVPAAMQPVHLLLGTVAFGAIFYLFLQSNLKYSNS